MAKRAASWRDVILQAIDLLFGDDTPTHGRKRGATRRSDASRPPRGRAPVIPAGGANTVHRVRQKYRTSCGVAVAAMFARATHTEALEVMFPARGRKRTFYTTYADVVKALDHFGVKYEAPVKRVKDWAAIPATALVRVRWKSAEGKIGYHWVILQRRSASEWQVIDPDPGRSGTQRLGHSEISRYTPMSYLAVHPVAPGRGASKQ